MFVAHVRANQRIGRDAISLVRNNSHCKEEVVVRVQHDCIHISIPVLFPFGHLCNWETLQP